MQKAMPILLFTAASILSAQNHDGPVSSRFGLNIQMMLPTDTAGSLYKTGYNIGIPFYFRQGEDVEGRLRVEIGHFDGKNRTVYGEVQSISADTRYVGYDWLIKMGPSRNPGVDFLVGVGGAHWYQSISHTYAPGSDVIYVDDGYGEKLAFVLSLGFLFHINSHVGIEAKQMLTSLPNSRRDFHDADLSHTSLGVAFRF
ncbi:MAG: hypothetical protein IPP78_00315 [Holophagaceae bacterium]|nr:hypothetical protein [Holophagaceae bacterium]